MGREVGVGGEGLRGSHQYLMTSSLLKKTWKSSRSLRIASRKSSLAVWMVAFLLRIVTCAILSRVARLLVVLGS